MNVNILSLDQFLEKDYNMQLEQESLYLRNGDGSLISHVSMTSNMVFLMNIDHDAANCLESCFEDSY